MGDVKELVATLEAALIDYREAIHTNREWTAAVRDAVQRVTVATRAIEEWREAVRTGNDQAKPTAAGEGGAR